VLFATTARNASSDCTISASFVGVASETTRKCSESTSSHFAVAGANVTIAARTAAQGRLFMARARLSQRDPDREHDLVSREV